VSELYGSMACAVDWALDRRRYFEMNAALRANPPITPTTVPMITPVLDFCFIGLGLSVLELDGDGGNDALLPVAVGSGLPVLELDGDDGNEDPLPVAEASPSS